MVDICNVFIGFFGVYFGVFFWQFVVIDLLLVLLIDDLDMVFIFVIVYFYDNLMINFIDWDFIGVKLGDVNGIVMFNFIDDVLEDSVVILNWIVQEFGNWNNVFCF